MNPQIRHAQRACEAAKARQAIVVWFDEHGQFAVASYGETKAECTAVKPLCNAIGDALLPRMRAIVTDLAAPDCDGCEYCSSPDSVQLRGRLKFAIAALRHYADSDTWLKHVGYIGTTQCGETVAREALEAMGEE